MCVCYRNRLEILYSANRHRLRSRDECESAKSEESHLPNLLNPTVINIGLTGICAVSRPDGQLVKGLMKTESWIAAGKQEMA